MSAMMELANAIMFTTYALYYVQALGFTPLQLVLVGTFLELVIFVLEIPTGVVADTYGRRLSVIFAFFIMGFAYVFEGSVLPLSSALGGALSRFALVVTAEMVRGVGETFLSGAQTAWITDEAGEEAVGRLFVRANQIRQGAAICGVLLSVALSGIALQLPYIVGGIFYLIIACYLILFMPETNFQPDRSHDRRSWRELGATFTEGARAVRGKPLLLSMLLVNLLLGAASEGFDRLWDAHVIRDVGLPAIGSLPPSVWFGLIGLVGMALGIVTNEALLRRANLENERVLNRLLAAATVVRIAATIAFALAGGLVLALVSLWLLGMAKAVFHPVYDAWLNRHIPSRTRATVLSFLSQSNALGQTAGGPVVGWVGTVGSIRRSLLLAAVFLIPILAVLRKPFPTSSVSATREENE